MKSLLFSFFLILKILSTSLLFPQSQNSACVKELDFLINKVSTIYAGYYDKVTSETKEELEALEKRLRRRLKLREKEDFRGCTRILREYLNFFKDKHLYLVEADQREIVNRRVYRNPRLEPSFKELNDTMVLFEIPTFQLQYKAAIDSLILLYKSKILSTPHVILDVRNNTGGSDVSYRELLPFLYTGPVIQYGIEFRSTDDNTRHYEEILKRPGLPESSKQRIGDLISLMKNNVNSFVDPGYERTIEYDTVYTYPQNVYILINGRCASSTEAFLLFAKQSKKVTLLGKNTMGAIDYGNTFFTELPSGKRQVAIPVSRSKRALTHPMDLEGIAPDVRIPEDVRDYIGYVIENIEKK